MPPANQPYQAPGQPFVKCVLKGLPGKVKYLILYWF